MGQIYLALGRYSEAESSLLAALNTFQNVFNSDHFYIQETLRRLNVLVQTVLQADRAADLSDHPLTQSLLQELTTPPHP
ncbi:hypothetical protein BCR12_07575 [Limnothrix sp. P13C2]|nr:hypothetical protein BCR12_07575 [Limnothrix sp. P13C2]